jgi:hypothetical protein
VLDEHFAALNACDWNRLLAQYPEDAQINLPNGVIVKGRAALGDLFAGFCKDAKDGGLNGIQFTVEHSTTIENTFATQWVATAPFLAEPYRGSDAYITHDGYMQGNGHHVRWRRSQDEEIGARPARGRTANKATAIAERSAVAF